MRLAAALVTLSLGACAATPPAQPEQDRSVPVVKRIAWVRVDNVVRVCGGMATACFKIRDGVCFVYTRHARETFDSAMHTSLGHEIQHCFDGYFHGDDVQNVILRNLGRN